MIRIILEMPDAIYEQLRTGIGVGFFKFSLKDLVSYNITIKDIQHCEDSK